MCRWSRCAARPGTRRGAGKRRAAGWRYRCTPRTSFAMWCAPPRRLLSDRSSVGTAAQPPPCPRRIFRPRSRFQGSCTRCGRSSARTAPAAHSARRNPPAAACRGRRWVCRCRTGCSKTHRTILSKWSGPLCRPP